MEILNSKFNLKYVWKVAHGRFFWNILAGHLQLSEPGRRTITQRSSRFTWSTERWTVAQGSFLPVWDEEIHSDELPSGLLTSRYGENLCWSTGLYWDQATSDLCNNRNRSPDNDILDLGPTWTWSKKQVYLVVWITPLSLTPQTPAEHTSMFGFQHTLSISSLFVLNSCLQVSQSIFYGLLNCCITWSDTKRLLRYFRMFFTLLSLYLLWIGGQYKVRGWPTWTFCFIRYFHGGWSTTKKYVLRPEY